jgi:hypothetical protein
MYNFELHKLSLLLIFVASFVFSQTPKEKVMKDFPTLYNNFQREVEKQKSRYVFAIDISNSMKTYESSVKMNLKSFINELPDGDFISLIQMASTQNTKAILANQPLNGATRSLINTYIDGLKFDQSGSDGYTMTEKIIQSLNQTGSSEDMKYVFMFTDFEYWTKENQFDKNKANWKSLGTKLKDKSNRLKVFGLELFQSNRSSSIYKSELKDILGKLEEISVSNTAFLNTWFSNMKADILCDRLRYVLDHKTSQENAKLILSASGLGKDLSIIMKSQKMSSVYTTAEIEAESLVEVKKVSESRPWIGSYEPKPVILIVKARLRSPKYLNDKKSTPSEPYNEVDNLLDPQFEEYKIEVYEGKPYLAWYIGWPLLAFLVFWILSILYMLFIKKVTRTWSVSGMIKDREGISTPIKRSQPINPTTFCIGRLNAKGNFDVNIDGVGFCFKIESRKNISCLPLPGLKSGYYIANIGTGNAELIDAYKKITALGNNNFKFLSKPGAFTPVTLKIREGSKEFEIKIQ